MNTHKLESLIAKYPGHRWDEQVRAFAMDNKRTVATVYFWLSRGAPSEAIVDAERVLAEKN